MPTQACIYCKRVSVEFNREHVIPEAFGSYGGDTLVLQGMVCTECNAGLGAELDQILSRDSWEALIRQQHLPQREPQGERFVPRRFKIHFPDREEFGIVRGARLTIDWDTRRLLLLDQVIVRDRSQQLHIFLEENLPRAEDRLFQNLPPQGLRVVGTNTPVIEKLIETVRSRGVNLGNRESLPVPAVLHSPDVSAITEGQIDLRVWRAIAKIAFNYLASTQGSQYVLDEKFDKIRLFIVGTATDRAMVRLLNSPILSNESYHWRSFEGHLVAYQTEGRSLRGKVALYNTITYEVMLCSDLGLYYALKSGHAFDPIQERSVSLSGTSLGVLRPASPMNSLYFFSL